MDVDVSASYLLQHIDCTDGRGSSTHNRKHAVVIGIWYNRLRYSASARERVRRGYNDFSVLFPHRKPLQVVLHMVVVGQSSKQLHCQRKSEEA